jgi:hypothetical protein
MENIARPCRYRLVGGEYNRRIARSPGTVQNTKMTAVDFVIALIKPSTIDELTLRG